MIEIERKFHISSMQKTRIEEELQQKYGPLKSVHQVDEVFLLGITSFKDFTQGMAVTRLRTENGTTQLAYKRRINTVGDMIEHELAIDSAEVMRLILTEMGYYSVTFVDKVRLEIKVDDMAFMIDSVNGLGDFLEIEVVSQDDSTLEETESRIMAVAQVFGLTDADIELKKYDQLLAQIA